MTEIKVHDKKIQDLRKKVLTACGETFGNSDVMKMLTGMAVVTDLLIQDMAGMADFPNMSKIQRDDMVQLISKLLDILHDETLKQKKINNGRK